MPPIDWSNFNPNFGAQIAASFDPVNIAERQNKLTALAMQPALQNAQMQTALYSAQKMQMENQALKNDLDTAYPSSTAQPTPVAVPVHGQISDSLSATSPSVPVAPNAMTSISQGILATPIGQGTATSTAAYAPSRISITGNPQLDAQIRLQTRINPEMAKAMIDRMAWTTEQKNAAWLGLTTQESADAARRKLAAEGMMTLRENTTAFNPITNQPIFTSPTPTSYTTWNNGIPTATPVAGSQDIAANLAGAKTAAEQAAEIKPVVTASGATVPMRMGDAVSNQPTMSFPGKTKGQLVQEAQSIPDPVERQRFINSVQSSANLNQPSTNADVWSTMPKIDQPQDIGQTTMQHEMQKGQGDAASKLAEKHGSEAEIANQRIAINNQALDLVNKADTGAFASQIASVKNILTSTFGIPEGDFLNPSDTIALQKDLVNAATQKAKTQFGSRITQSEVMLMLSKGSPNVDMPKAAIKYLLNTDNATAQYNIQKANDLGKYISSGGDPYRFEAWYSAKFPITKALSSISMSGNTSSAHPSTLTSKTINGVTYVNDGKGWKLP